MARPCAFTARIARSSSAWVIFAERSDTAVHPKNCPLYFLCFLTRVRNNYFLWTELRLMREFKPLSKVRARREKKRRSRITLRRILQVNKTIFLWQMSRPSRRTEEIILRATVDVTGALLFVIRCTSRLPSLLFDKEKNQPQAF
jgi:hypothetical protein